MNEDNVPLETQFSLAVIALMKGIISRQDDEKFWNKLVRQQAQIRDYVEKIGLDLRLDEAEGFAWLAQRAVQEGETPLPRLVSRFRLSYATSLLLALLRGRLAEQDAQGGDTRLVLTLEEIQEMMALFLPATGNQARRRDQVAAQIAKAEELGFLRRLGGSQAWEVRRLLGLFVDAQWLGEFDQRLTEYRQNLGSEEPEEEQE